MENNPASGQKHVYKKNICTVYSQTSSIVELLH